MSGTSGVARHLQPSVARFKFQTKTLQAPLSRRHCSFWSWGSGRNSTYFPGGCKLNTGWCGMIADELMQLCTHYGLNSVNKLRNRRRIHVGTSQRRASYGSVVLLAAVASCAVIRLVFIVVNKSVHSSRSFFQRNNWIARLYTLTNTHSNAYMFLNWQYVFFNNIAVRLARALTDK